MIETEYINFHKLYETDIYICGHIFERAFLIDKIKEKSMILGEFYGDPTCAIIDLENKWCLVGGSTMFLWTAEKTNEIKDNNLKWALKLRQIEPNKVQILIDPWSDNSSIWEFDIMLIQSKKISDFNYYKDKEYSEIINW